MSDKQFAVLAGVKSELVVGSITVLLDRVEMAKQALVVSTTTSTGDMEEEKEMLEVVSKVWGRL